MEESPSKKAKKGSGSNKSKESTEGETVDTHDSELPELPDPDATNEDVIDETATRDIQQQLNVRPSGEDDDLRTRVSRVESYTSTGEVVSVRVETVEEMTTKLDSISSQNEVIINIKNWDMTGRNSNIVLSNFILGTVQSVHTTLEWIERSPERFGHPCQSTSGKSSGPGTVSSPWPGTTRTRSEIDQDICFVRRPV